MRVLRVLKRTLAVLLFVCMTLKIQLELRVLRSGWSSGGYTPWWGNETLGHLRAFPKLALNTTLRTTRIANSSPNKTGNINHVPQQGNKKSDANTSNRKILSDAPDRNGTSTARSGTDIRPSRGIEVIAAAAKSPGNSKTRAGIFAKLRIYDGVHTIDTDTIYNAQQIGHASEKPIEIKKSISPVRNTTSTSNRQVLITQSNKPLNSTKALRRPPRTSPKITSASSLFRKKIKASVSREVSHDVDKNEISLTKETIAEIKQKLKEENEKQTVYNQEAFGPVLGNTTILLVQVHKRLENLRYLVSSLRSVKGIQEAMVVFSHDLWDPAINAFVRNITDFRVMQMFFPFSIQLYPLVFPGRDPADCSWNTNAKAKNIKCGNAKWPDSYGHYREASFTQIKHHWWWKMHRVFEGLKVTQNNYTGHVVFLEEDHYVSPDLLHVLGLMQRLRPTLCPSCQVLTLGNYNKLSPNTYKNLMEKGDWWVTKYNLGFAMDAAVWRSLGKCKDRFCTFDDYNWDWTMTNVAQTCLSKRLAMLSVRLSRVLHVGTCGTHVRKKVCDVNGEVRKAVAHLSISKPWLFPRTLRMLGTWKSSGKPKKGNGGWGDYRDRQLCQAIGNSTADEAFLTRLQAMRSI